MIQNLRMSKRALSLISDLISYQPSKRLKVDRDWSEWVSASATRNYLLKDPVLDWLSHTMKSDHGGRRNDGTNFVQFIMDQGIEFEKVVVSDLYRRFGDNILDIDGGSNARSIQKFNDTVTAMEKGVPIIYSGVLHSSNSKLYGVPDLIVRGDWLSKLVRHPPPSSTDSQKYRIVDIKFSTLALKSNGTTLLNSGSFPAYKGQLWVYNSILSEIQGEESKTAYILGRKWRYTSKGQVYSGSGYFDRLGTVDFATDDRKYTEQTQKAVNWIRDVRKFGHEWKVDTVPLPRSELYPNMSNPYDYPWHGEKVKIAKNIHELTLLWMCGPKNRELAHQSGIYRWNSPKCTPEVLGISGNTSRILSRIIEVNRDSDELMLPKIITDNTQDWKVKKSIEFYVDFEMINLGLFDILNPDIKTVIFMIGVGYYTHTGQWMYTNFTVSDMTLDEENRICRDFYTYVCGVAKLYGSTDPLLIHWSPAETSMWFPKGLDRRCLGITPVWFDLLTIFRKEPICIKGCMGFGLKEIASTMQVHGMIGTDACGPSLEKTSPWQGVQFDGSSAMLLTYKAWQTAKKRGIPLTTIPVMKDIIRYNEVDCRVLGDILVYIRKR